MKEFKERSLKCAFLSDLLTCRRLISLNVFPIGQYQVLGRVVHMKYIKEHLASKEKVKFGDSQKEPNNIQLEVWADTVYIEVCNT